MPLLIDIPLKVPEGIAPVVHWGSIMNGALMEKLKGGLGDTFHREGLKPFSQHMIISKEKQPLWRIAILEEELEQSFLSLINSESDKEWELKQKGIKVYLEKPVVVKNESYKGIADNYFLKKDINRRIKIVYKTPTSFKKDGEYVIIPTIELVIKSLFQRWDSFSKSLVLNDNEVRDQLISHCRIIGYDLKSTRYELEGVAISGFWGNTTLSIKGPDALVRIVNMLLYYSTYSGLGIKTALGMGGIEIYG